MRATPSVSRYDVRKVAPDEAAALADTLARAFYDDPIVSWVYPNAARRLQAMRRGFELYLRRVWLHHEETYTVGERDGVCVWEPPGTWKLGTAETLSLLPAMLRIYGRTLPRLMRVLAAMERDHPEDPHYYLAFIGVAPECQGEGKGSILMYPVLQRCDTEGVAAYLEASSPRSRDLYARHGFEVSEEVVPARGAPPLWRMWRDPR